MSIIKKISGKKFNQREIKSFKINGEKSNNTISYDEIIKNKNITIDIIIDGKAIYRNKEVDYYEN